jgi:ABC-type Mn2+/Zn2+ transport system ATPase subunit
MVKDKLSFLNPNVPHQHGGSHPALDLQNLDIRYDGRKAIDNLSLQVESGLSVAVVGPNGAGKSTLFHVLAGVLHPASGTAKIHGHLPTRHLCTAYVPQSRQVDWSFPVCVADVVMMGRTGLLGLLKRPDSNDRRIVAESLEKAGISQMAERQISELSGGQKQRMFIARALAQEADLMLLDEPLAGLDLSSQEQVFRILEELKEGGVTVLFATHDLELAGERFDRILLLNKKLIAFGDRKEVFRAENLSAAFGGQVQMVDTVDGMAMIGDMGGHHDHDEEGPHG